MAKSRSTILDKAKVRARAWEFGIHSQAQFEIKYGNKFNKHGEHSAPIFAWNGESFSTGGAREIADLLQVDSYHELEPDKTVAPWTEFIQTHGVNDDFSEFIIEDPEVNLKGMLDFNKIIDTSELQKIDINHSFYFKLQGKIGESFIILLSSPNETMQIAPITAEGFEDDNLMDKQSIRYPSFAINFDKNQLGWRRFIVIKGNNLPITIKNEGDFSISPNELNTLAFKLKELDVMVNVHEFVVVAGIS